MEMEFSKIEKIVGTFVAGVFLLLVTLLVMIGRGKDWFETYVTYYTSFKETYNLQENAPVKLFRADIGKVAEITLEKNRVIVKLAIREKYTPRIREDTVAVVESPTLIGSEYIAIIPGSTDAPPIPDNGKIPSREKRSIDDLLTEFEVEKTAKLIVKAIQDISIVSETLSDPDGPLLVSLSNIERVSRNIEKITSDLEAGKGPMGLLFKSENLLQQMVGNMEKMSRILENIDRAAASAPDTMLLVNENLMVFNRGVEEAKQIIAEIHKSTDDLQIIMENIKAGSHQVPEITSTFKEGILEIRQGVEEVDRVVESLQRSVFIRGNLPPAPTANPTEAGARP